MSESVELIDPELIRKNPENPRLIFRSEQLESLLESIKEQGILVPLSVYKKGREYFLLDGERRWRCARKLKKATVPVIVQSEPDKLTNLMMMFAIHNARADWDPLPTALKLQKIADIYEERHGRQPNEVELAGLSSMSRGEVRRLKKLLSLPQGYQDELLSELEKPKAKQVVTVDLVLEATKGVELLAKRGVIKSSDIEKVRRATIEKYKEKIVKSTVAPRKFAKMSRAVQRGDVKVEVARRAIEKYLRVAKYSIDDAFADSVEFADTMYEISKVSDRLCAMLRSFEADGRILDEEVFVSVKISWLLAKKLRRGNA